MPVKQDSKIVSLRLPNGDSAEIYTFGATVTSFVAGGRERLYLSKKAVLDGSKAIRGGVPICFPFVGPPPTSEEISARPSLAPHADVPQHGFARVRTWNAQVQSDHPEKVSVVFTLPISSVPESFRALQPTYTVELTPGQLRTELKVKHIGQEKEEVPFKALLHTYLATDDSKAMQVTGLRKGAAIDDRISGEQSVWEGGAVKLNKDGVVTQFLQGTGGDLTLEEGSHKLRVRSENFDDGIFFNPQEEAGSGPWPDMEVGDGKRFMCVEPGHMRDWISLQAGAEFIGAQILSAE